MSKSLYILEKLLHLPRLDIQIVNQLLQLLQQLLLEAAAEHPKALRDPTPVVLFTEFGDSSLNFELGVWTQEMTATPIHFTSEMNFIIEQKLRENGIEIPFPQRDLHVRSGLPATQGLSGEV